MALASLITQWPSTWITSACTPTCEWWTIWFVALFNWMHSKWRCPSLPSMPAMRACALSSSPPPVRPGSAGQFVANSKIAPPSCQPQYKVNSATVPNFAGTVVWLLQKSGAKVGIPPRADFRSSVRFYRDRRENSKLSVVSLIVAKMMPSAVLASSRRVGSRASCF